MYASDKLSYKNLLEYNQEYLSLLKALCQPLERNFNFTLYSYRRIYKDNKLFYLSLNPTWIEYCFENELWLSREIQSKLNLLRGGSKSFLWSGNLNDPLYKALYEFDIWNGISVYEYNDDYIEVFAFSSTKNNVKVCDFYINNFYILKQFITYFKERANLIIESNSQKCFLTHDLTYPDAFDQEAECKKIEQFFLDTKTNKFYLSGRHRNKYISRREAECLHYLSLGKTAKEIGAKLNLSVRTVECHLRNVKQKLNVNSKSQLVEAFLRSQHSIALEKAI